MRPKQNHPSNISKLAVACAIATFAITGMAADCKNDPSNKDCQTTTTNSVAKSSGSGAHSGWFGWFGSSSNSSSSSSTSKGASSESAGHGSSSPSRGGFGSSGHASGGG